MKPSTLRSRPSSRLATWMLALVSLGLASCTTSDLEVRHSADPNPFVRADLFALEPIQFLDLQVDGKPEAEYVAGLDADQQVLWERDKVNIDKVFALAVERASGKNIHFTDSAPLRVRPVVSEIESGYYRIPAWNAVTRIYMSIQITDANGRVADEIYCHDGAAFDALMNPTVGGRLGSVAKSLGNMLGEYLEDRTDS